MATNNNDQLVQELTKIVNAKKAAIAKAERPNWRTNCAFRYSKDSSASINLQVCGVVEELVYILGFLCEKRNAFNEAQKIIGTNLEFKWFNFTFDDWAEDIKTRIDKIEITTKKKELEMLEERLNKLISPELRAQMELEEIRKTLGV
jgi:hypothetical protein